MSAALSLLDDDPFEEPKLTVVPDPGAAVTRDPVAPAATNPRPAPPAGAGWSPVTVVPGLLLATLVASPALVQGLVRHQITAATMLERWGLVALGCCALGEAVRRYVLRAERDAERAAERAVAQAAEQVAADVRTAEGQPGAQGTPPGPDPSGMLTPEV